MQRRADKLADRAGIDAGIAVKGDDISCALQSGFIAEDNQLVFPAAQQLRKLGDCAALSFPAGIFFAVKVSRTGKKIESIPIFAV